MGRFRWVGRQKLFTGVDMGSGTQGKEYRRGVDLLRFVACFGIVWDHARAYGADIGYLALAVFLLLTSFFAVQSFDRAEARGQGAGFWLPRAQRILMPWLVWCVIFKGVQYLVADDPASVPLLSDPFSLLVGSWIHLWFLPFAMIFLVVIPPIARSITTRRRLIIAGVLLVSASLPLGLLHGAVTGSWSGGPAAFPQPFPQWFFSLPLFLYGALAAIAHRLGAVDVVLVTAAVASALLFAVLPEFASLQMILAALVLEAVWRSPITGAWATRLAASAFGIYLMHPFFMLVAFKLFGAGMNREFGAVFAFCASWAAAEVMMRLPGLRKIV